MKRDRSSVQSKPCAFANPVQFSSVVNLETQVSFFSCYRVAEKHRFCSPLTNPTISQWFPRSSVQLKPCAFANPVQFSSIVNSETTHASLGGRKVDHEDTNEGSKICKKFRAELQTDALGSICECTKPVPNTASVQMNQRISC